MALAITILGTLVGLAARRVRRIEITGDSMLPVLEAGDRIVVVRAGRPRVGDVVACADPRHPGRKRTLVKRVAAGPGGYLQLEDGSRMSAGVGYILLGDNSRLSTDSRHFGPTSPKLIIGRLVFRYAPPGRAGRFRGIPPASC